MTRAIQSNLNLRRNPGSSQVYSYNSIYWWLLIGPFLQLMSPFDQEPTYFAPFSFFLALIPRVHTIPKFRTDKRLLAKGFCPIAAERLYSSFYCPFTAPCGSITVDGFFPLLTHLNLLDHTRVNCDNDYDSSKQTKVRFQIMPL